MLSITRRIGEAIVIGDPARPIAVVRLFRAHDNRALIGVQADRSIPIHREEIAHEIVDGIPQRAKGD